LQYLGDDWPSITTQTVQYNAPFCFWYPHCIIILVCLSLKCSTMDGCSMLKMICQNPSSTLVCSRPLASLSILLYLSRFSPTVVGNSGHTHTAGGPYFLGSHIRHRLGQVFSMTCMFCCLSRLFCQNLKYCFLHFRG
jgi:hypothetical protein